VFRAGSRLDGTWLQVVAAPAQSAPGRVGFVIGRKAFRHAVDRNRIRRVLRVAVGQARPALEAFDMIVRVKCGCRRDEVRALAAEAARLFAALTAAPPRAIAR
jgi:ribonuclease P protein component